MQRNVWRFQCECNTPRLVVSLVLSVIYLCLGLIIHFFALTNENIYRSSMKSAAQTLHVSGNHATEPIVYMEVNTNGKQTLNVKLFLFSIEM